MAGKKGNLNFTVSADVEKAVRDMGRVIAKQEQQIAQLRKANAEGKKGKESFKGMNGAVDKTVSSLASMALKYASIGSLAAGVTSAFRKSFAEMKQAVQDVSERLEGMRDLMFLGDFQSRHPAALKEIGQIATEAGLTGNAGSTEVARAWELIESKMPHASDAQKKALLEAAAQYRRSTSVHMDIGSNLMVQLIRAAPKATPLQITNFMQQAKLEAGANTEGMAQYLPELFGVGQTAGMTVPEIGSLFAVGSGGGLEPSRVSTGIRVMLMRLKGKELTPAGQEMEKKLGISPSMNVIQQLGILAAQQQAGKVGMPELQEIFGQRSAIIADYLMRHYSDVKKSLANLNMAWNTDRDLLGEQIHSYYKPGTIQYEEEKKRQFQAAAELAAVDRPRTKAEAHREAMYYARKATLIRRGHWGWTSALAADLDMYVLGMGDNWSFKDAALWRDVPATSSHPGATFIDPSIIPPTMKREMGLTLDLSEAAKHSAAAAKHLQAAASTMKKHTQPQLATGAPE